ncbi:hypothetical protein D3C78_1415630 [compost metagenome]
MPNRRSLSCAQLPSTAVLEVHADRDDLAAIRHGCFRARCDDGNAGLSAPATQLYRPQDGIYREVDGVTRNNDTLVSPQAEPVAG